MKSRDIRQSFMDFFTQRGHHQVPSAPVVPHDDPTLLFTNAGMNQFKPYFLGQATPEHRRVVDTQKCIRVSGKHNDVEEVGYDTYHHTFFEMLGNWSFGDYYKREAIAWGWELLTKVWGLPKERLYATVYGGDEKVGADVEAERLWAEVTDIDPSHIKRFGRKDNFWMMGDTGPCGPCSEIHIDLTPDASGGALVNQGSPLVMELWNLVFIQYNAEPDGSLRELPSKHVDTGMGFERACAVVECTDRGRDFTRPISNYDTEVFQPIIRRLAEMSNQRYAPGMSEDKPSIAMRVVADHLRMVSFSLADGVVPSNEGRGYVVRRLVRRAARHGRDLGFKEPFMWQLVEILASTMGDVFPEIVREQTKIANLVKAEETSFLTTLERGIGLFEEAAGRLRQGEEFPGETAFRLYDTYGFPIDLTQVMARERGMQVDVPGFERHMEEQRKRAREARVQVVVSAAAENMDLPPTFFTGYEELDTPTHVRAVLEQGKELQIVLEKTPFYAEMGGQIGDTGVLEADHGSISIQDTQAKEGVVLHRAAIDHGRRPEVGEQVVAHVNHLRRWNIQRHHTATHLLHWALREVLGTDVRQQGSVVEPDRLRFDFTHNEQVKAEQLRAIERLIQERILENEGVSWFEIPKGQKPENVISFFGDKYGGRVRVLKIGGQGSGLVDAPIYDGYSMELCGGTHVRHTGDMGLFRFTSESAIAAGVRRVEAVVGNAAMASIQRDLDVLHGLSSRLAAPTADLEKRIEGLLDNVKRLEKELGTERAGGAVGQARQLVSSARTVGDIQLIVANVGQRDADYLRLVADALKGQFTGIAVLAGTGDGKVSLLAWVDKALVSKGFHAGKLIGELARQVGGGGGGRPDLAQAGGKDVSALPAALASVDGLLMAQVRA
ncbi:MAG TPA: alanine--tRNA ligase [Candidatus Xenobia bacterium]|jgi:alanyl-tRNA synthetase